MAMVETILQNNSIVKRLIAGGNISRERLKKIYRAACKLTHPDLRHQDGREFIQLRAEYEEALAHWDELERRLVRDAGTSLLREGEVRRLFYAALRHYLAAGLYSLRVRIKPAIKKRNELIFREVLDWAKLYDPSFIAVFLEYNKVYLRRYVEWQKRDNLRKAQKLFLEGFRNTVDYAWNRSELSRRAARSYLADSLSVLGILPPSPAGQALQRFAAWFAAEAESLPRKFKAEGGAGRAGEEKENT